MLSGSGPLGTAVSRTSMAAISSLESSKPKTSKFSAMRATLVDFGIADRPSCAERGNLDAVVQRHVDHAFNPYLPTIFCRCSGYRAPWMAICDAARRMSCRSLSVS